MEVALQQQDTCYTKNRDVAFKAMKHFLWLRGVKKIDAIINEYYPGIEIGVRQKCIEIQEDFMTFKQWCETYKKLRKWR